MNMLKKIKKIYKSFDIDKKNIWGGYHIEKTIFQISFFLVFCLLIVALVQAPSTKLVYVNCPLGSYTQVDNFQTVSGCDNPFFNKCNQDIVPCDLKVLEQGSVYGEPFELSHFLKYFWLYCVSIIGLAFLYNHLKYNRGKKC